MTRVLPRYPVYIPSKGRATEATAFTVRCLRQWDVPFRVVVEPQEEDWYRELVGDSVLVLPFSDLGQGSIPARNWIKQHAIDEGHERHWQLDDNIRGFHRYWKERRIPCVAGVALRVCEDLTDRYQNVAISGLAYSFFVRGKRPPAVANCHVYSCTLVNNKIPHQWRGRYNEDTDICLQVLSDGWCTILVNAFLADKMQTMTVRGGNTDDLYRGDGRLVMSRSLERKWPGVVTTHKRFGRPQHLVNWQKFDTPLQLRDDVDPTALVDDYGIRLVEVSPPRDERARKLLREYQQP